MNLINLNNNWLRLRTIDSVDTKELQFIDPLGCTTRPSRLGIVFYLPSRPWRTMTITCCFIIIIFFFFFCFLLRSLFLLQNAVTHDVVTSTVQMQQMIKGNCCFADSRGFFVVWEGNKNYERISKTTSFRRLNYKEFFTWL